MELFFPLLAVALVYLASWGAGLYLLFQCILLKPQWSRERNWIVTWVWVWPVFLVSLIVTFAPLPPVWVTGRIGIFAPFLWLFSLYIFRKNRLAERRTRANVAQPLDAPQDETVWPPAPLK